MAAKTTTKSKGCKHCKSVIDFGMVCESCVAEHRVCQMCGVDISERDASAMTCGDAHKKTRQRRLNAIEKQGDIKGTVPSVPSETEQPRASETALIESVATSVARAIASELGIQMVGIGDIIAKSVKEAIKEVALMQVQPTQQRTDLPKVVAPKPLIIEDDELPMVGVKKITKSGESSQNFLNSIMALNG